MMGLGRSGGRWGRAQAGLITLMDSLGPRHWPFRLTPWLGLRVGGLITVGALQQGVIVRAQQGSATGLTRAGYVQQVVAVGVGFGAEAATTSADWRLMDCENSSFSLWMILLRRGSGMAEALGSPATAFFARASAAASVSEHGAAGQAGAAFGFTTT